MAARHTAPHLLCTAMRGNSEFISLPRLFYRRSSTTNTNNVRMQQLGCSSVVGCCRWLTQLPGVRMLSTCTKASARHVWGFKLPTPPRSVHWGASFLQVAYVLMGLVEWSNGLVVATCESAPSGRFGRWSRIAPVAASPVRGRNRLCREGPTHKHGGTQWVAPRVGMCSVQARTITSRVAGSITQIKGWTTWTTCWGCGTTCSEVWEGITLLFKWNGHGGLVVGL